MKAIKFTRVGVVELVDEPDPEPAPGEELVEIAFAGICGSDLHGIRPGGFRRPPLVMGHEFSGTTPDGRRVAVNAMMSCGGCDLCAMGREQLCRQRAIIGIDRPGGLAERVCVPTSSLVELPGDVSLATGAMIEPLAVAHRAWNLSGAGPDARVGIIGSGNLGLMLLAIARMSTKDVMVTDLSPDRLRHAERHGAARTGPVLDGEIDVTFDAVGAGETHAASVESLRPGGTAVWLGCRSAEAAFDALDLVRSEQRVIGSLAYTRTEFIEATQLARSLPLDWATIVGLAQGATTFMELATGRSDIVKALVQPSGA